MKRVLILSALALAMLLASACDETPNCTQCGFEPNEHIVTTYTDGGGSTIYISGYANSSGCFTAVNCP